MTQEEKQLLVKDLCARLPYNVRCLHKEDNGEDYIDTIIGFDGCRFEIEEQFYDVEDIKPYLRPISSMIKDEAANYLNTLYPNLDVLNCEVNDDGIKFTAANVGKKDLECIVVLFKSLHSNVCGFDWLNAHYFDCRGLIEKGLALRAPEGMYKTE